MAIKIYDTLDEMYSENAGGSTSSARYLGAKSPTSTPRPSGGIRIFDSLSDMKEGKVSSRVPGTLPQLPVATTKHGGELGLWSGYFKPMMQDFYKESLAGAEVAGEFATGMVDFLAQIPAKLGWAVYKGREGPLMDPMTNFVHRMMTQSEEERIQDLEELDQFSSQVSHLVRRAMHLGADYVPSERGAELSQMAAKPFEWLHDTAFKPARDLMGEVAGAGGALTVDALEAFFWLGMMPKVRAPGIPGKTKVQLQTGETKWTGKPETINRYVSTKSLRRAEQEAVDWLVADEYVSKHYGKKAEQERARNRVNAEHMQAKQDAARRKEQQAERAAGREDVQRYYEEVFGDKANQAILDEIKADLDRGVKVIDRQVMEAAIDRAMERLEKEAPSDKIRNIQKSKEIFDEIERRRRDTYKEGPEARLVQPEPDTSGLIIDPAYREKPKAHRTFNQRMADYNRAGKKKPAEETGLNNLTQPEPEAKPNELPPKPTQTPEQATTKTLQNDLVDMVRQAAEEFQAAEAKKSAKRKAALEEIKKARDAAEYFDPAFREEPQPSTMEQALYEDQPRGMRDILDDLTLLVSDKVNVGLSVKDVSPVKIAEINAARDRLIKDIAVIKRNAANTGKDIKQYLVDSGMATPEVADAVVEWVNREGMLKALPAKVSEQTTEMKEGIPLKERRERRRDFDPAVDGPRGYQALDEMHQTAWDRLRKSPQEFYSWAKAHFIDKTTDIRKAFRNTKTIEGERVLVNKYLMLGSRAGSEKFFRSAKKRIFEGLTDAERKAMDSYARVVREHVIEIYERSINKKKHRVRPEGITPEFLEWAVENPEALARHYGLTPEQVRKVMHRTDLLFETFGDLLRKKYEAGLITEEMYNLMRPFKYMPTKYLIDAVQNAKKFTILDNKGQPMRVEDPRIHELKHGLSKMYELNAEALLGDLIYQTDWLIAQNKANLALRDFAERGINPDIARPAKTYKVGRGSKAREKFKNPPMGFSEVGFLVEGKVQRVWLRTDLAKQWVAQSMEITPKLAAFMRLASLSPITRAFATGAFSPMFWIANLPMDMAHIAATALRSDLSGNLHPLYNRSFVGSTALLAKDIVKNAKDVFLRRGLMDELIEHGGGMEFLTEQGKIFSKKQTYQRGKLRTWSDAAEGILGYMNKTSELLTRVAVYDRAKTQLIKEFHQKFGRAPEGIELTRIKEQAAFTARDYLDFNQGGGFVKAMDTAIPYLNAGIQTTRGIFRYAAKDPKGAVIKALELASIATAIYVWNQMFHKEEYGQISSNDKNKYFHIRIPGAAIIDEYGEKRALWLGIRKDNSQMFVSAVTEMMLALWRGDRYEYERLSKAILEMSPIRNVPLPPLANAIFGYMANVDTYTWDKIWRGNPNVDQKEEWTNYTNQLWKNFSKATGLSPVRAQYAVESIFTRGNEVTGLFKWAYDKGFNELDPYSQQSIGTQLMLNGQFRRFIRMSHPSNAYRSDYDEIDTETNTRRLVENRAADAIAIKVANGEWSRRKGIREIYSISSDGSTRKRLVRRLSDAAKMEGVENKGRWLDIIHSPNNEARARKLLSMMEQEGRRSTLIQAQQLGILTPGVREEMIKLQRTAPRQ